MSANLVPSSPNNAAAARADGYSPMAQWGGAPSSPPPSSGGGMGEQVARTLAALKRYKWLVIAVIAVGSTAGFILTRFVSPKYDVSASIWIAATSGKAGTIGPVSAPGLVNSDVAWMELARSFSVLDKVVGKLALYVYPDIPSDTVIVRDLFPSDSLQPGLYRVDLTGDSYTLIRPAQQRGEQDVVIEKGTVGDSIGRSVGFQWQPSAQALAGRKAVGFYVVTPREAAFELGSQLTVSVAQNSNLMRFQLSGSKPGMLATTLNTLSREFVSEAVRLKRENLTVSAEATEEQLQQASQQLAEAQSSLERFKINTITLPNEQMALTPGVSTTMNPVFTAYFNDRVAYEQVRRDREALDRIVAESRDRGGKISLEALRSVSSAVASNTSLQSEISNLNLAKGQLVNLQKTYTDEYRMVKDLKQQIELMEAQSIPTLVSSSLTELLARESEMKRRIDGASQELKQIPARTVEEMRLNRELAIAQTMYVDLQQRSMSARLSERNALPEVSILDTAVAPRIPSSDTTLGILLVAIAASVGLGLALALLLDRLDKRFRYPDQATVELGLDIVGAIPSYKNPSNAAARLEEASQLIESFRTIALSVRSAFDGLGPVQLAISSPGPGDGKSFVSANLASALADSGYRTVIVDGDIRRGALHEIFGPCDQTPGLVDYLAGDATLSDVVRPTQQHVNLSIIPGGTRRRHGPELLASERMTTLIRDLRNHFDAIVVDTAPLGAGIDPFAVGTATGNMVIVLRAGETDRKLAQAKLTVLDRMPIRLIGAILNDIGDLPQFKYYYYLEGYRALDSAEDANAALIGSGAGNGK
ncbi:MAG: polysaccharide biosynthesis tyrosine autokinase [Gemmatimonadetes bacterium]|nr:polysaccharide biosynthesis tyrosine autokinase [Gemmatimonadota bacterium]